MLPQPTGPLGTQIQARLMSVLNILAMILESWYGYSQG
jgi:hypothetical protein